MMTKPIQEITRPVPRKKRHAVLSCVCPLHLCTESTTVLCKSGATKSQLNQLLSHTDSSCVCLVPSSSPLCYNPYFLLRTTFPSAYDDDHTGAVLQCTTRTNVGCTFHIIPSKPSSARSMRRRMMNAFRASEVTTFSSPHWTGQT